MSNNTIKQDFNTSRNDRMKLNGHRSFLIWFTGLSGSGKSTLADNLEMALHKKGVHTYSIDGDNLRNGLNSDLSFSPEDRTENIRRIANVAKLFIDSGVVTLAAFISPYKKDREHVKEIVGDDDYIEIYVSTPIEECENRDVKGLYKKARAGEISSFTGISAPYETPENPNLIIDTTKLTIEEAVEQIIDYIEDKL